MTRAYVGLGANLGAREVTIVRAVDLLAAADGVSVVEMSQLRETDPIGVIDQPAFLNGVVAVDTTLDARTLLETLLEIERELGRVRKERCGPRTIDLDLLVFGDETIDEPGLTVPHPRLGERPFALEPLTELAPALVVPGLGRVDEALTELD